MTGTAKQIAYANDIITNTIARIDALIAKKTSEVEAREARIQAKIPGYIAKADRVNLAQWEMAKKSMAAYAPETAAEVIEFEKETGWFSYMAYAVSENLFEM